MAVSRCDHLFRHQAADRLLITLEDTRFLPVIALDPDARCDVALDFEDHLLGFLRHVAAENDDYLRGVALIDGGGQRTYLLVNRAAGSETIEVPARRWLVKQHFAGVTDPVTAMQVETSVQPGGTALLCRPYSLIVLAPAAAE